MKNSETKEFIAYEYLNINVKSDKEPLYTDCYEAFGWILTNNAALVEEGDYYLNNLPNVNVTKQVNLKFKRDRKIPNKGELQTLQRKMENSLKEIDKLEKEPMSKGVTKSLSIGLIGTIFLAISVFAITASTLSLSNYIICIISGIIGLAGWLFGFLSYKNTKTKVEKENTQLIEEQYNAVYDCCEKASKLIK